MIPSNKNLNLLIAGVGGQGILVASQLIGTIATQTGWKVRISEDIGLAQRGGAVVSHVRLGHGLLAPIIPVNSVDLVIGLEPLETYRNVIKYLKPEGDVVFNNQPVIPAWNPRETLNYPTIERIVQSIKKVAHRVIVLDALQLAQKANIPIAINMVMLGAATALALPFTPSEMKDLISKNIPREIERNLLAFEYGYNSVQEGIKTS